MTPVTIVMTTWLPNNEDGYKRLNILQKCLISWHENLIHDDDIFLHVADDGSDDSMTVALKNAVLECWPRHGTRFTRQERHGVGASLNKGIRESPTDIVLHAVDDWELLKPLDIRPWVSLLEIPDIAGFRLFPHPDLSGKIQYMGGVYAMKLDRHHFAFATRPSLWHKRMFQAYGKFEEQVSAYECERLYNLNYCLGKGPDLWMALPDEWRHVDGVELGDITP